MRNLHEAVCKINQDKLTTRIVSYIFIPLQLSAKAVHEPLERHVMFMEDPFSLSIGVRHVYTAAEFSTCPVTVILDDGMKGGGPQSTEMVTTV